MSMTTPRVTVPVEPTEAMLDNAAGTLVVQGLNVRQIARQFWSAMLSAATREEAPIDAGVEGAAWEWIARLYPNDAPSDLAYDANEMIDAFIAGASLRAQPQARKDAQPVAWRWKTPIQHVGDGTRWGWTFASHPSTPPASINAEPLYTNPAADALRVALQKIANFRGTIMDGEAVDIALAALQAEQGAK